MAYTLRPSCQLETDVGFRRGVTKPRCSPFCVEDVLGVSYLFAYVEDR